MDNLAIVLLGLIGFLVILTASQALAVFFDWE